MPLFVSLSAVRISVVLLQQTIEIPFAYSEDFRRSLPVAAAMIQDGHDMTPFESSQGDVVVVGSRKGRRLPGAPWARSLKSPRSRPSKSRGSLYFEQEQMPI